MSVSAEGRGTRLSESGNQVIVLALCLYQLEDEGQGWATV